VAAVIVSQTKNPFLLTATKALIMLTLLPYSTGLVGDSFCGIPFLARGCKLVLRIGIRYLNLRNINPLRTRST
jgi:hypothetical protein